MLKIRRVIERKTIQQDFLGYLHDDTLCGMLFGVATFEITVTGDLKGVASMDRQIKFASAKAINDTGKFAQEETVRELDDEFILRGNWYKPKTRFGINFSNAKFTANVPEGVLFTRADWLLESEGYNSGVKTPDDGGQHLADPEDPVTRGPITRKFPRSQKAGNLLLNAQAAFSSIQSRKRGSRAAGNFKIKSAKTGNELIYQRVRLNKQGQVRFNRQGRPIRGKVTGRGGTSLVLKHVLKKQVKVDRPMIIQKTGVNVFRVWYPEYFNRNLLLAFRTAK